ncbi:MAG: hypothetical protein ABIH99_01280, partial [Candidatus Micrarchaeota archaeon]
MANEAQFQEYIKNPSSLFEYLTYLSAPAQEAYLDSFSYFLRNKQPQLFFERLTPDQLAAFFGAGGKTTLELIRSLSSDQILYTMSVATDEQIKHIFSLNPYTYEQAFNSEFCAIFEACVCNSVATGRLLVNCGNVIHGVLESSFWTSNSDRLNEAISTLEEK